MSGLVKIPVEGLWQKFIDAQYAVTIFVSAYPYYSPFGGKILNNGQTIVLSAVEHLILRNIQEHQVRGKPCFPLVAMIKTVSSHSVCIFTQ
jgi:hypothetical protein